jgi:hypothetical protein
MRRMAVVGFLILMCSLCAVASERADFASLPAEARAAITTAMRRNLAARNPAAIEDFTLTPDGLNVGDFGGSVAIDGNTVVIGAVGGGPNSQGAAYVFVKPPSGWGNMTQTAILTSSVPQQGPPLVGYGVAIRGDTVVVGAPDGTVNGNYAQGIAYIFVKPQGGWTNMTETAMLTASDGVAGVGFGKSVAISGNTVLVGAPLGTNSNGGPGTAYVFVRPARGWVNMTQTAELTASDGSVYNEFGSAVSISGQTIIVGADEDGSSNNAGLGAAYIFVEPPQGWADMTQTAELMASDGSVGDAFGLSVSLDNDTAVIGAANDGTNDDEQGAVYVFVEPSGGWVNMTQTAELTVSIAKIQCLGSSVSISGSVILTGDACEHDNTGAVYVFLKPTSGWQNSSQANLRLSIPFKSKQDYFGASVAISGTTGVVGAPVVADEAFVFTKQDVPFHVIP